MPMRLTVFLACSMSWEERMQSMASSRVRYDPYNGEDEHLQQHQGSDLDDLLDFTNVSINTRSSDKISYSMKIYTEFTFILISII